jgi:hypothetical protein
MRRHVHRAQFVDEILDVIALVGSQGDTARPVGAQFDHGKRSRSLGMTVSLCEAGIGHQAVAVLNQRMAHIAKLGLFAISLAVEASLGISHRGVRLVRALLAVEVDLGIAALVRWIGGPWPALPENLEIM